MDEVFSDAGVGVSISCACVSNKCKHLKFKNIPAVLIHCCRQRCNLVRGFCGVCFLKELHDGL